MTDAPRIHVLANTGARRVQAARDVEAAYLPLRDAIANLRVEECPRGDELAPRAREAAASGATTIVAAGGDGTISAVASALVGGDVPLGVLPMGTFNHFAQDLGVPLDAPAAARVTVHGTPLRVDVGFVNHRAFLNTATLGVYFDVVATRERWMPRVGKLLATLVGIGHALRHPPLLKLDLEIDGRPMRARVPVLWAGNNRYALQWPEAGRRARLDEGMLTLVLVHETKRLHFLRQVWRVFTGRSHLVRDIEVTHPRRIVVSSALPHLRIALDGEVAELRAPLRIEVREKALPILVPREGALASLA